MAEFREKNPRLMGLRSGAKVGLVSGAAVTFFAWFAASLLKGLITDFTGVWPDWFPGHIVDLFLSRWWIVIAIVSCMVAGALVGAIRQRRYELL